MRSKGKIKRKKKRRTRCSVASPVCVGHRKKERRRELGEGPEWCSSKRGRGRSRRKGGLGACLKAKQVEGVHPSFHENGVLSGGPASPHAKKRGGCEGKAQLEESATERDYTGTSAGKVVLGEEKKLRKTSGRVEEEKKSCGVHHSWRLPQRARAAKTRGERSRENNR